MRTIASLAASITVAMLSVGALAACSPQPTEVDLSTFAAQAETFETEVMATPGTLGSGTFTLEPQTDPAPVDPADAATAEDAITLNYPDTVTVSGTRVACFGTGAVSFDFATRQGSSWMGSGSADVPCDGEPVEVSTDTPRTGVDAIRLVAHLRDGDGAVLVVAATGPTP